MPPLLMQGLLIPPDVFALIVAGLMWIAAGATPSLEAPTILGVLVALPFFAGGAYLIVTARFVFARVGTTYSPVAASQTT